jgi:hypothetical protein
MRLLGSQAPPMPDAGPVDWVDDALRVAARREFFTTDEALARCP